MLHYLETLFPLTVRRESPDLRPATSTEKKEKDDEREIERNKDKEIITASLPVNIVPIDGGEGFSGLEACNLYREERKRQRVRNEDK